MNSERHAMVGEAFLRARALTQDELRSFLASLDETDGSLRTEVEGLLRNDPDTDAFLAEPLLDARAAAAMLRLPAEPPEELPTETGAYRILRELGEGSSAVVYLAQQTSPVQRLVALKVLRQGGQRGEAAARFRGECDAIARMQHPGIATLLEASHTPDGRPFFVMEHIAGAPITDYCRRVQPSVRERLQLFLQVVAAVSHAHQKAVVHRDLKPTNILVAEPAAESSDPRPIAKVIDFGVAKRLEGQAGLRSYMTAHGQLVGTLAYMSPEQLGGDPALVDVRTDVYALGAVLHEMLTGGPAINLEGLELPEAIRRVERGRGHQPRETRSLLSRDLELIIAKAMAIEPNRRYQSAPELAAEIERFLENRPVLARGPGLLYTARKAAYRHPALTTGLVVAIVALNASAPWIWLSHQRAKRHYEVSRQTAKLLLNVIEPISDQIGARPARRAMLTQALAQSAEFTAQEAADPEVQQARADILGGLGDLEEEEGRLDRATAFLRQALVIRQRLAAAAPDDLERRADLSIAIVRMGDMHKGHERWADAITLYLSALAIDERLVALEPDNAHFASNLAWSYERLGARMVLTGERARALFYFTLQLRILDRLERLQGRPDDIERCRTATYLHLGQLARDSGDYTTARLHGEKALTAAQRALAAAPASRLAMMCVFRAWIAIGASHRELEEFEAMHWCAQSAAESIFPLVQRDNTDGLAIELYLIACDFGREAATMLGLQPELADWTAKALRTARLADPAIGRGEHLRLDTWRDALSGAENPVRK